MAKTAESTREGPSETNRMDGRRPEKHRGQIQQRTGNDGRPKVLFRADQRPRGPNRTVYALNEAALTHAYKKVWCAIFQSVIQYNKLPQNALEKKARVILTSAIGCGAFRGPFRTGTVPPQCDPILGINRCHTSLRLRSRCQDAIGTAPVSALKSVVESWDYYFNDSIDIAAVVVLFPVFGDNPYNYTRFRRVLGRDNFNRKGVPQILLWNARILIRENDGVPPNDYDLIAVIFRLRRTRRGLSSQHIGTHEAHLRFAVVNPSDPFAVLNGHMGMFCDGGSEGRNGNPNCSIAVEEAIGVTTTILTMHRGPVSAWGNRLHRSRTRTTASTPRCGPKDAANNYNCDISPKTTDGGRMRTVWMPRCPSNQSR